MQSNFFPGFKLEEVKDSKGRRFGLPVRYYDWSIMMVHFPAPNAKVAKLLPSKKLKPLEITPGTALVTLAAMQHRHVDQLSSYNEAAVLLPVQYEPALNASAQSPVFPTGIKSYNLYFHHLPVTTQEACDLGVDIYGFPKFVADISFEDTGKTCRSRLSAQGKDIMTLEVKKLTADAQPVNFFCYTTKNGQLLRTFVPTQGQFATSQSHTDVSYSLGNHPIAQELRDLEMNSTALEYLYAPHVQGLLFPPGERFPL